VARRLIAAVFFFLQENPDLFKWLTMQEPIPEEHDGPVRCAPCRALCGSSPVLSRLDPSPPSLRSPPQVFRRIIESSTEQVSIVEEEGRTTTEWNSAKWWSDQIDDEMRDKALAREAEAELAAMKKK